MTTDPPSAAFFTGSTGFIGSHLLASFLRQTDSTRCIALVRASSRREATKRLKESLQEYGLWRPEDADRMEAVVGDVARESLGLDSETYAELVGDVGLVFHAAARVDWLGSYEEVKSVNVEGLKRMLAFAGRADAPVHYESSINPVFHVGPADGRMIQPIREHSPRVPKDRVLVDSREEMYALIRSLGYFSSKYVAELVVEQAREQGLDVTIYRFSQVTGNRCVYSSPTRDLFWQALKGTVVAGFVPDVALQFHMVPVDFLADAQVHLAMRKGTENENYHPGHIHANTVRELGRWLESYGYELDWLDFDTWQERAPEHLTPALTRIEPIFRDIFEMDDHVLEMFMNMEFDCSHTLEHIGLEPEEVPAVDRDLFRRYIDSFVDEGFLPAP